MDAFTHFFVSLALWNILLATLAFLFGLLMGHWMWGQFKGQLAKVKGSLAESEREVGLLADDAARLRENNLENEESFQKDRETLSADLKASRAELEKMEKVEKRASEVEAEAAEIKSNAEKTETLLTELKDDLKNLNREHDEVVAKVKKAQEEQAKNEVGGEEWSKKERQLTSQINKEKSESASLREVITGLNDRERELKKKLENLEEEQADKDSSKDS
ncbi:MAG: hypothetical protein ACSHYB_04750 [Roseibacillus sp.]